MILAALMDVRWSIPAAEDLEHICEWIERDNPETAGRVARRIYDECAAAECPDDVSLHSLLCLTSWSIR